MPDEQVGIADRIVGEGGFMPPVDGGAQSLCCLPDRQREGLMLLNPAQMLHGITAPESFGKPRQPGFGGRRHRPSRTDPRLAFIAVLPGHRCRSEFAVDHRDIGHDRARYVADAGTVNQEGIDDPQHPGTQLETEGLQGPSMQSAEYLSIDPPQ